MESRARFTAKGATFLENEAGDGGGGGIYCGNDVCLKVTESTFTRNKALGGGGVALFGARKAVLENCHFHQNRGHDGGGIYSSAFVGATIHVTDCTFDDNLAGVMSLAFTNPSHSAIRATATEAPAVVFQQGVQAHARSCVSV